MRPLSTGNDRRGMEPAVDPLDDRRGPVADGSARGPLDFLDNWSVFLAYVVISAVAVPVAVYSLSAGGTTLDQAQNRQRRDRSRSSRSPGLGRLHAGLYSTPLNGAA